MFTGIVKEVGRVKKIIKASSLIKLGIETDRIYEELEQGDSVSIGGVCLTLVNKEKKIIFFDVLESSLKISNLKRLKIGDYVNLEPALKVGGKLGGHFVLGHVDGEIKIRRWVKIKDYQRLEINLDSKQRKFLLENGSVSLEGISLTIKKIFPKYFTLDVIPFTYENTNLKYKRNGDWLNIEFDQLVKNSLVV